jgi:hypothetical protein
MATATETSEIDSFPIVLEGVCRLEIMPFFLKQYPHLNLDSNAIPILRELCRTDLYPGIQTGP